MYPTLLSIAWLGLALVFAVTGSDPAYIAMAFVNSTVWSVCARLESRR